MQSPPTSSRLLVPSSLALLLALTTSLGCGDDDSGTSGTGTGANGGSGGTGGEGAAGGAGAAGGTGAAGGAGGSGGGEYVPTAADISFAVSSPLPSGELLLINDWLPSPNVVRAIAPDGTELGDVFEAYRVWSMGATDDGGLIAFSSGDPLQEEHYGVTIGDAIQHTFLYDVSAGTATALTWGNINDECHVFGPGDTELFLCRRYDFTPEGQFDGYRVGKLGVSGGAFEFLTDQVAGELTLFPAPTPDGATLFYLRIEIQGGSQHRSIRKRDLVTAADELFLDDAGSPVVSPNGQRVLFANTADGSKLYSADLTGADITLVADVNGTDATYSPSGQQVAYLVWDDANACSHVEVVAADGSEAAAPTRIRDCSVAGDFVTDVEWLTH